MKTHKEQFLEKVNEGKITMYETLEEVLPNSDYDLKIGDKKWIYC